MCNLAEPYNTSDKECEEEKKKVSKPKTPELNTYSKSHGFKNPCPEISTTVFNAVLKALIFTGTFKVDDPRNVPFRHTETYQPVDKVCPLLKELIKNSVVFMRTLDTDYKIHGSGDLLMNEVNKISSRLFTEVVSDTKNIERCSTDSYTALQSINPIVYSAVPTQRKKKSSSQPPAKRRKVGDGEVKEVEEQKHEEDEDSSEEDNN